MRILIYGLNYAPELTGIGKYTGEMSEWLTSIGHEVMVVTAPPYYPAWKVSAGYSSFAFKSEVLNGVKVLRCPIWVPENPTGVARMLHLFSFAASSLPASVIRGITWRPDIVFTVEPALFCAPGAWLSARLSGARAWLHIQDLELDAAFSLGLLRSKPLRGAVTWLERRLMQRFDRISTISAKMAERIASKGVGESKKVLFPNWIDTDEIYPLNGPSPMRSILGIPGDATVLLYSGNMGEKQGLDIILEAAMELAAQKNMRFILCGDGAAKKRLEKAAGRLSNISFIPLQPLEKLNDLLNFADIHLLPQRADVEDLVMPSKLLGIFSSGRPVVATARAGTQVAKVVEGRGVAVEPGDMKAFTEAIVALSKDPVRRKALGNEARKYCVENWGKEKVLKRFLKEVEESLKG